MQHQPITPERRERWEDLIRKHARMSGYGDTCALAVALHDALAEIDALRAKVRAETIAECAAVCELVAERAREVGPLSAVGAAWYRDAVRNLGAPEAAKPEGEGA